MRECFNCQKELPTETEHYDINGEVYCTNCVAAEPYTAYAIYIDGEFVGNSDDDHIRHIESYEDDEYEEEVGEDV